MRAEYNQPLRKNHFAQCQKLSVFDKKQGPFSLLKIYICLYISYSTSNILKLSISTKRLSSIFGQKVILVPTLTTMTQNSNSCPLKGKILSISTSRFLKKMLGNRNQSGQLLPNSKDSKVITEHNIAILHSSSHKTIP